MKFPFTRCPICNSYCITLRLNSHIIHKHGKKKQSAKEVLDDYFNQIDKEKDD